MVAELFQKYLPPCLEGPSRKLRLILGLSDELILPWQALSSFIRYADIAANTLAINKKKTISKFIQDETDILIVEVAEKLLKGQSIDSLDECYIKELC